MNHDLQTAFFNRVATPSDINEHMPYLASLACYCSHVTEFGVRTGNSTCAFLTGLRSGGKLISYDLNPPELDFQTSKGRWDFRRRDVDTLQFLEATDMLFIDAFHNYKAVKAELAHAPAVRKWIVLHDTVLFAVTGEDGSEGIGRAVAEFLVANKANWRLANVLMNNNGLTVLERVFPA